MVRKCHTKNIYFAKHQKHLSRIRIRIRSDTVFFGSPDPDPYFENQIRGSGSRSEKMDRIRNTEKNEPISGYGPSLNSADISLFSCCLQYTCILRLIYTSSFQTSNYRFAFITPTQFHYFSYNFCHGIRVVYTRGEGQGQWIAV